MIVLLIFGAPGSAMTQTAFQTANKLFSSARSRSASFSIWYLLMNVGAAAAGFSIDLVRKTLELDITYIFVMGGVTAVISIVVTMWFIGRDDSINEIEGDEDEAHQPSKPTSDTQTKTTVEFVFAIVREPLSVPVHCWSY